MARTKKVWGVFYFDGGWFHRTWGDPLRETSEKAAIERRKALSRNAAYLNHTIIPGAILPDGSVAWPKKWPVP